MAAISALASMAGQPAATPAAQPGTSGPGAIAQKMMGGLLQRLGQAGQGGAASPTVTPGQPGSPVAATIAPGGQPTAPPVAPAAASSLTTAPGPSVVGPNATAAANLTGAPEAAAVPGGHLAGAAAAGGFQPTGNLERDMQAYLTQLLGSAGQIREDALEQSFGLFQDDQTRARDQALEQANRFAAATGRAGMGATNTSFGDITSEFDRNLSRERTRLSIEAAEKAFGDKLQAAQAGTQFAQAQFQKQVGMAQAAAQRAAARAQVEAARIGANAQTQMAAGRLAFEREALRQEGQLSAARLELQANQMNTDNAYREREFQYQVARDPIEDFFRFAPIADRAGGDISDLYPAYSLYGNAAMGAASGYQNAANQGYGSALGGILGGLGGLGGGLPTGANPASTGGIPGRPGGVAGGAGDFTFGF